MVVAASVGRMKKPLNRETFLHYRVMLENPSTPSYEQCPWGGVTVYLEPFLDDVAVGLACCSPYDQYNRRIGAAVARGRVKKLRQRQLILIPNDPAMLGLRVDQLAGRAWALLLKRLEEAHGAPPIRTFLLRGSSGPLVAPHGVLAYPWTRSEAPDAPQSDDPKTRQ